MNPKEYETILKEIRETRAEVNKIKEEVCGEKEKLSPITKMYLMISVIMIASLYTCDKARKAHGEEHHSMSQLEYRVDSDQ